ncbi:hypothetical protein C7M84_015412 [Penaeus vannamei]|uniref:Uncharacterized protein n=1 Tax=Penaeus vannamei TaxID=6689 RepID=A0A423SR16_PENVA|nr:multifunctional procollagen lysine hydroxylase and glycosyltransferase LH3-like [Penaeus vannamei]ROT66613.1 hypothetical protein C7M84_015412 [Penaeus vannamei]
MGFDYKKAHRLLWLEASKSNEDYLFMLDANVQLTNPDILQDLMRKRRNVVGPLLTHAGGSGHNLMTDYINHEFSEGFLAGDFVARRREENGTIDVGMLQVARIKSALLLTRDAFLHIKMKSFTSSGDDMWNRFFIHVFEQGYLPYACNQENYGHLTKADDEGKFTPDVWNLERNQEDFIAYFTFLQTPEGQEVALGEGECEGVARRWFFREPFARDLMARVEGGSGWEEAARKGASATAEVLAPPEGLERKAGQALAKFVVRNMMPQLDDTQVSSAGDLYVLKGSGSFSPEEASFVVLIALGDKVTKVEIQSKGERRCHLGLQKGEAASFRSADFPKLTFPQSVTLALMAL